MADMETDRDCFNFTPPNSPQPFPTPPETYDEVEVHTPLSTPESTARIQPFTPSDAHAMEHLGAEINHAVGLMISKAKRSSSAPEGKDFCQQVLDMFADDVEDLQDVASLTQQLMTNLQEHSDFNTNRVLRDALDFAKDYHKSVLEEIVAADPPAKRVKLEPASPPPHAPEITIEVDSSPDVAKKAWQSIFPSMAKKPLTPPLNAEVPEKEMDDSHPPGNWGTPTGTATPPGDVEEEEEDDEAMPEAFADMDAEENNADDKKKKPHTAAWHVMVRPALKAQVLLAVGKRPRFELTQEGLQKWKEAEDKKQEFNVGKSHKPGSRAAAAEKGPDHQSTLRALAVVMAVALACRFSCCCWRWCCCLFCSWFCCCCCLCCCSCCCCCCCCCGCCVCVCVCSCCCSCCWWCCCYDGC